MKTAFYRLAPLTSAGHPLEYAPSGNRVSTSAEVVKLVDTLASGASARKGVEVQVLSSAPIKEGLPAGAFFVSRSDSRPAPRRGALHTAAAPAQEAVLPALSSAPIKEGLPAGAFFVSRSDSRPAPRRGAVHSAAISIHRLARRMAVALLLSLSLNGTPALAEPPQPAPMTTEARDNRPYLMLFPLAVLGIIGVLLVIKRRK